jgi:hypothetical protein
MRHSAFPSLLIIIFTVLAGCSSKGPEPAGTSPASSLKPQQASTIVIDLAIPIEPLARQVNDQVPLVIERLDDFEMDESGRFGVKYRIHRDQIRMGMRGTLLRSTTTFRYGLTACVRTRTGLRSRAYTMWPCVSCGMNEPPREAAAVLDTRISVGSDWRVRSVTTAQPVVLRDDCSVTLLDIDISRWKVAPFINEQLEATAAAIDTRIAADTTLHQQVASVWRSLTTPLEIAPRVWLSIAPEDLSLGSLSGEGAVVNTTLGLRARPSIIIGSRPRAVERRLPAAGAEQARSGLEVGFQAILPFPEAATLLESQFTRSASGAHPIRMSNVRMSAGRGEEVIFTADAAFDQPLGGRYDGPITLRGRPSFVPSTQTIVVEDLDYRLEEPGLRARIADLVLHGQFRERLAQAARWPVGPRIEACGRALRGPASSES